MVIGVKYKILDLLTTQGMYISGEKLSKELGISRNAVWKNIKSLKKDGYVIEAAKSRGYRLCFSPEKINPQRLKAAVPGNVYYYVTTESTNLEAKRSMNTPNKSVFIAEAQTAGRGRLGRAWTSPPVCGIWMSIYLEPEISAQVVSQLTLIAGLAVSRVIPKSKIKWPNDVLMGGKKVCGILTEMSAEMDRVSRVIVGIGINVNNRLFPAELADKATSVYLESGKITDREELAKSVLNEFFCLYDEFLSEGLAPFIEEYSEKCATLGREVIIIRKGEQEAARAVGISENGELIIERDGIRETVHSGEVSVRGLLGYN